ncbi:MAG: hypothetical protein HKN87_03985 [Saprospiraceae bacterium]|nr:hypothetical protein [Saprospiraceae bacterium]
MKSSPITVSVSIYQRAGIIALVVASIFSIGFFQSDEHFQILEFAGMKMGMIDASAMPWEYAHQMRSAFQPLLVVWSHQLLGLAGVESPFVITAILRLCSAALTLYSMLLIYRVYAPKYQEGPERKWFGYLSFLLWFMILVGVRFSSEGWSGSLIVIGCSIYFLRANSWSNFLKIGVLFGLAYLCRYQVSLIVFGFVSWLLFIHKEKFGHLMILGAGILGAMILGLIIDYWFYGEWTWTFWNYIDQNIIHDKVSNFGVDPWWSYLPKIILALIPPFSLLPILCLIYLLIRNPRHELVWLFIPFLFIHFMIGHKELRFLFPLVGFLPALVMEGIRYYQGDNRAAFYAKRGTRRFGRTYAVLNTLLLLFICFTPFDRTTPLYQYIYQNYKEPTTLYFIETDPYKEGHLRYYRRPNLEIVHIDSLSEIMENNQHGVQLFATERPMQLDPTATQLALRFKTLPEWVYRLNFNGWIERTYVWYLYEKE